MGRWIPPCRCNAALYGMQSGAGRARCPNKHGTSSTKIFQCEAAAGAISREPLPSTKLSPEAGHHWSCSQILLHTREERAKTTNNNDEPMVGETLIGETYLLCGSRLSQTWTYVKVHMSTDGLDRSGALMVSRPCPGKKSAKKQTQKPPNNPSEETEAPSSVSMWQICTPACPVGFL